MKTRIISKQSNLMIVFFIYLFSTVIHFDVFAEENPKALSLSYSMNSEGSNFANISFDRDYVDYEGTNIRRDIAVTSMSIMNTNNNFTVSTSQETTLVHDGKILLYNALFDENGEKTEMRAYSEDGWLILEGKTKDEDFATWNTIEEDKYDLSVANIPFDLLQLTEEESVRKILDLYSAQVKDNKMKILGKETLTVDEKKFECDIVAFDYGEIRGTMWIGKDELGYFLVKEDAKSDIGDFQMLLDSYTEKEKNKKETEFGF